MGTAETGFREAALESNQEGGNKRITPSKTKTKNEEDATPRNSGGESAEELHLAPVGVQREMSDIKQ